MGIQSAATAAAVLIREGAAELFQRKYERLWDLLDLPKLFAGELREVYQLRGELYDQGIVVPTDGKIPGQPRVEGEIVLASTAGSNFCKVPAEDIFLSGL